MAKPNLQNYSDVAESLQRVCILIFDALFALGVDGKRQGRQEQYPLHRIFEYMYETLNVYSLTDLYELNFLILISI